MNLVNHLDFWLMVATFAFLFYYFVWKKVARWIIWAIISIVHYSMPEGNDNDRYK
jgi:hypothetical protein